MVRSMTGYGRAQETAGGRTVTVEVRSVNHRFADVAVRLPREWTRYEDEIRRLVLQYVRRGRVDVSVAVSEQGEKRRAVRVNEAILACALGVLRDAGEQARFDFESPSLGHLLAIPGLFELVDQPEFLPEQEELYKAAADALQELAEMRRNEGERLREHLARLHGDMRSLLACLQATAPLAAATHRERLEQKMRLLLSGVEVVDERIAFEAALVAERSDIEEELSRLDSHLGQVGDLLAAEGEAVGRRLDFLVQELQREIHTIGAKASDLRVTGLALEARHVIEQMREQLQNVE